MYEDMNNGYGMQTGYEVQPDYCMLTGYEVQPGYGVQQGYNGGIQVNYDMYMLQQQMANMQQQQMMLQQQMGYKPVRYTKQQYLDGLRNYVMQSTNVYVTGEDKLEDFPQGLLRHACSKCGISFLSPNQFYVPETGVIIPFFFCTVCGKLFYLREFV